MAKSRDIQRIAFGRLLTQGFVLIQSVAAGVTNDHIFGMPTNFLGDKEREHLKKIVKKLHTDADHLRDFGNYLQRSSR